MDRSRYDSATFWALLGSGIVVLGGIVVGIGVNQADKLPAGNDWANPWFDAGIVVGVVVLLWALVLFLAHQHAAGHHGRATPAPAPGPTQHARPRREAKPPSPTTSDKKQPSEQRARDEVQITPAQLIAFYNGVTDIQGDRLVAPYIGKWITVDGVVENVDSGYGGKVRLLFEDRTVYPWFDAEDADRVSLFLPGNHVTVQGQVVRVDRHGVSLDHCEIRTNKPGTVATIGSSAQ